MIQSKIKGRTFDARLAKTVDTWVDVKNVRAGDWKRRIR